MNKVVCEICGTSFSEDATKCPICGYVQSGEKAAVAAVSYSHVKGGRFSKSNVKKRNQNKQLSAAQPVSAYRRSNANKKKKSNVGIMIVIVLLLLAILAVTGYIVLRFLLPNDFMYEGLGNLNLFGNSQTNEEPESDPDAEPATDDGTAPSLECTSVELYKNDIQLDGIGTTYKLQVSLEPADTLDMVSFSSSDESVVTVSEDGVITAVGEGSAVITVTCGSVSTECFVICTEPEPETQPIEFTLNRKEITFKTEGESWLLYNGEIPHGEIIWSSDDNSVATIEAGKVVAVGNGETTVQGLYNDQSATCVIRCEFEEEPQEESGNISEATGEGEADDKVENDDGKTYELFNPYGYAKDVTIRVGDKFTLKLVDEKGNEVTDAQWSVEDNNVCTYENSVVTGVKSGMTKVTATYKGKTYTSIIRVY